jgi:flagellar basal-body rod protein FlgF
MSDGIYIAMSGAAAQERALDVVANNLANTNTVGFKAERITFAETLAKNATKTGEMSFVGLADSLTDHSAGQITATDNPLDLAIAGEGYFALETPTGIRYTRAGDFRMNEDGRLVSLDGHVVRGTDGDDIQIPPNTTNVSVNADGIVSNGFQDFGTVAVVQLDPKTVHREGNRLFTGVELPEQDNEGTYQLLSGSLEDSNFTAIRGMVDIVRVSRIHEAQHRMLETYRQINNRAARDLGGGK